MNRAVQLELFAIVLDEIDRDPDTVSQVIEATLHSGRISLLRHAMPP